MITQSKIDFLGKVVFDETQTFNLFTYWVWAHVHVCWCATRTTHFKMHDKFNYIHIRFLWQRFYCNDNISPIYIDLKRMIDIEKEIERMSGKKGFKTELVLFLFFCFETNNCKCFDILISLIIPGIATTICCYQSGLILLKKPLDDDACIFNPLHRYLWSIPFSI